MSSRGALEGLDYSSPLVKYRGEKVLRIARLFLQRDPPVDYVFAADVFYAFYLPAPILREDVECSSKPVVLSILTSHIGVYLRSKTVLDVLASTLASSLLMSYLFEKQASTAAGESREPGVSMGIEDAEHVLAEVARQVEVADKVRLLVGGLEPGVGSDLTLEDYSVELLRLAREADVREVLKVLGGVKRWELASSSKYTMAKRGEKLGYVLGHDVERLSPRSLAYPDEVFYARFAEGKLLLYEKGIRLSRSPIYVLVDKSGSMNGEKIVWAKAVAMALYIKATRSSRDFYVRFFDSEPHPPLKAEHARRASSGIQVLSYIARVKSSGGTDITKAISAALSDAEREKLKELSIVVVTDGIDRVNEKLVLEKLKSTNSRLISVMVKGDNQSLRKISAHYFRVEKLSQKEILKVVKTIG